MNKEINKDSAEGNIATIVSDQGNKDAGDNSGNVLVHIL